MSVVEAQSVSKSFGDFAAVDDVSFTLEAGTVMGLVGPNGAGKTTTIRMLLDTSSAPTRARSCSSAGASPMPTGP